MDAVDGARSEAVRLEPSREESVHGLPSGGREKGPLLEIEEVSLEEQALLRKPDEEIVVRVRVFADAPHFEPSPPIGDDTEIRHRFHTDLSPTAGPPIGCQCVGRGERPPDGGHVAGSREDGDAGLCSEGANTAEMIAMRVADDDESNWLAGARPRDPSAKLFRDSLAVGAAGCRDLLQGESGGRGVEDDDEVGELDEGREEASDLGDVHARRYLAGG